MIHLHRFYRWFRRHRLVKDFTLRDWGEMGKLTAEIEREHPAEVAEIRARVESEFRHLIALAMARPPSTRH
jgi:hypothetical protein